MRISDWSSDVCSSDLTTPPMSDAIQRLYAKVTLERGGNPKTSRNAKLFADGRTKIAKKLVEEASEVSLECVTNNRDESPSALSAIHSGQCQDSGMARAMVPGRIDHRNIPAANPIPAKRQV